LISLIIQNNAKLGERGRKNIIKRIQKLRAVMKDYLKLNVQEGNFMKIMKNFSDNLKKQGIERYVTK
jgi:hypothetical protein